jgi:hypothetical protein
MCLPLETTDNGLQRRCAEKRATTYVFGVYRHSPAPPLPGAAWCTMSGSEVRDAAQRETRPAATWFAPRTML